MNKAFKYMFAGALATVPMTFAMVYLYERLPKQEKYPLPPRTITMNVAQEVGVKKYLNQRERFWTTMFCHFSYGAMAGAFYFPLIKKKKIPSVYSGMSFGFLVWGVSYLGILPALHLYPKITKASRERNALMILTHMIWGATLGLLNPSVKD